MRTQNHLRKPHPRAVTAGPASPEQHPWAVTTGPASPEPHPWAVTTGPASPEPHPWAVTAGPASPGTRPSPSEPALHCCLGEPLADSTPASRQRPYGPSGSWKKPWRAPPHSQDPSSPASVPWRLASAPCGRPPAGTRSTPPLRSPPATSPEGRCPRPRSACLQPAMPRGRPPPGIPLTFTHRPPAEPLAMPPSGGLSHTGRDRAQGTQGTVQPASSGGCDPGKGCLVRLCCLVCSLWGGGTLRPSVGPAGGVGIRDTLLSGLLNPHCFLPLPHPLFPRPGCPASHPQLTLEASWGGQHSRL